MVLKISNKTHLVKLAERREPYWQSLTGQRGNSIGVRRTPTGIFWLARTSNTTGKKYSQINLEATSFDDAVKEADRRLFNPVDAGVQVTGQTVLFAFKEYLKEKGKASTTDASVEKLLGNLANKKLLDLKKADIKKWVYELSTKDGQPRPYDTLRRMLVPVKACLNRAVREDYLIDTKWREGFSLAGYMAQKADIHGDPVEALETRRYITPAERKRMIAMAPIDVIGWLRLCCNTPLRPGDWNDRRVKDFDPVAGTLYVNSKANPRHVKLSRDMTVLLSVQSKNKTPNALLFSVGNNQVTMWDKYGWNDAIKSAAKAAGIDGSVCLYDLRHSTINDLIEAGLSVTQTAIIAGTSIKMIDDNYRKAIEARQVSALEKIAI